MAISQALQRWHTMYAERVSNDLAQFWADEHGAVVGEADQAFVEGGIPQCREQKPVVDVEALLVSTLGPGDDVRGTEQRRLGNACQWAAADPVVHEGIA